MRSYLTEFSYGYAITDEMVNHSGIPISEAPFFPSLRAEGQKGGGFDVRIPFEGVFLFLQFKLSDHMTRRSATECIKGIFDPIFYRMHIHPRNRSNQHRMLLELEDQGELVYYVAPKFHRVRELNFAYIFHQVVSRSLFIQPSRIGPLKNDEPHHVAFKDGHPVYIQSKPRVIRKEPENERTSIAILEGVSDISAESKYDKERLLNLSERMIGIAIECRMFTIGPGSDDLIYLSQRNPFKAISYMARIFFNCELLIVKPREVRE